MSQASSRLLEFGAAQGRRNHAGRARAEYHREQQADWEMTAGARYEARELDKAINAHERAGQQAPEGKLDLQRGFILVDPERWEEAEDVLERALQLGGLNNNETGNAHLLRGTAKFNLGHYGEALKAFNKATNYGKVENAAREWISHVQEQRSRRASS